MPNNLGGTADPQQLTYRGRLGWQYFPIGPVSLPFPPQKSSLHPGDHPAVFEAGQLFNSHPPMQQLAPPVTDHPPRGVMVQAIDQLLQLTSGPASDPIEFKPRVPTQHRVDNPKYRFGAWRH